MTVSNEAPSSPVHKRRCLEISWTEDEMDLPNEIFPSKEENEAGSYNMIYPTEESSSGTAVECLSPLIEANSRTVTQLNNVVEKNSDSEEAELKKISQLLIGTCCDQLCLCHLTATDVISAKVNYSSMTVAEQRRYLFNKLKEGSCECNPKPGMVNTKFFIAGKEICEAAWENEHIKYI